MEAIDVTSSAFWDSSEARVLINERDPVACERSMALMEWVKGESELRGHLLFATSGSMGAKKWVALSRAAMLASAAAVNGHLGVTGSDHWLVGLPLFHVGGMGMVARAHLAGCGMTLAASKWDANGFLAELVESGANLTSLVPTQLVDLVRGELRAPESLRAVLVGGGALDDRIYHRACDLGWPVVETYGMTETASQVATAVVGSRGLRVLPCWQTQVDDDGLLLVRGEPLMTGYVEFDGDGFVLERPFEGGWFVSRDRVVIDQDRLEFVGRDDRCVKVLGELVDLTKVESVLRSMLDDERVAVVGMPDERSGHRLVVCAVNGEVVGPVIDHYNRTCSPVERIDEVIEVSGIPVSSLGKVRYAELTKRM